MVLFHCTTLPSVSSISLFSSDVLFSPAVYACVEFFFLGERPNDFAETFLMTHYKDAWHLVKVCCLPCLNVF